MRSLFDDLPIETPGDLATALVDLFEPMIERWYLPEGYLAANALKSGGYSIKVGGRVAFQITEKKGVFFAVINKESSPIDLSDLSVLARTLWPNVEDILQTQPHEYSCCSRYEQCSDAGRCVHPSREFAMECYYKRVLISGRCFYGKRANVSEPDTN